MVGRESELALIDERLTQVAAGHGQIVGITGEAGIGKSRLLAEALGHAIRCGLRAYSGDAQSYGMNASYLVWHNIWWNFFDLDPIGTIDEHSAALERQLKRIKPQLARRLPLLGAVLNLPLPDNDLTRSFDARLRKMSLEALLVDCVWAQARETPLLLVLEDCQWMDALSHDLLEAIGRAIANLPVLIVMAYRLPETPAPAGAPGEPPALFHGDSINRIHGAGGRTAASGSSCANSSGSRRRSRRTPSRGLRAARRAIPFTSKSCSTTCKIAGSIRRTPAR